MSGDRREFAREGWLISAHLRVGTRIHEGTLINISEKGAFCATRSLVEAGAAVQVRFRHPWTDDAVTAAGVIMRRSTGGDGLGPQAGVAIALLESLSGLEDSDANVSLSDSLVPGTISTLRQLRERAVTDEAGRSGDHATVTSGPHDIISGSHPLPAANEDGRITCTFEATGRPTTVAELRDVDAAGFTVLTPDPPDTGRLVRIEVDPPSSATHPTRMAGKVSWSSSSDASPQAEGFGVQILHFLSSADERRFHELLLVVHARR